MVHSVAKRIVGYPAWLKTPGRTPTAVLRARVTRPGALLSFLPNCTRGFCLPGVLWKKPKHLYRHTKGNLKSIRLVLKSASSREISSPGIRCKVFAGSACDRIESNRIGYYAPVHHKKYFQFNGWLSPLTAPNNLWFKHQSLPPLQSIIHLSVYRSLIIIRYCRHLQ